jgi:hypothetical protein
MGLNLKRLFFEKFSRPEAFVLLAFFVPLVLRAIPEVLMGSYIVGFDTLAHYVPATLRWLGDGVSLWTFVAVAPFLHAMLMGSTSIGIPIVISLKVMSPLLLGLLGIAVYFYANKTLCWSPKKSLIVVLFATLYFVALRISWDMLRSELALVFLFVTLIFLKKDGNRFRNGFLLSLAMLAVVFAHQLVALIMFAIVLATIIRLSFDRQMGDVSKLIVCSIPAILLFLLTVYANSVVFPQFSFISGWLNQSSESYLTLFGFASYQDLVVDTFVFLVFCYLLLLPLVIVGVRRLKNNLQLNTWVLCIIVVLSLAMANIFVAHLPYRWILLLTYPLAFYAAEGFSSLRSASHKILVVLLLAMFSASFIFLPNNIAFPYYSAFPLYMPTSMLQNTVPLSDCQDTMNALQWVKTNMGGNASLLVHRAFYGWASLTLDEDQLIFYNYGDPVAVAQELTEDGSRYQLWLIWWVNGSGWYDEPNVSSAFGEVLHENGRIAVYMYTANA